MKHCIRCGEAKPLAEFFRKKAARDGRHSYCRPCVAAHGRQRYRERVEREPGYRERLRAKSKARYEARRGPWHQASADKRRARAAVNDAVRGGHIVPPDGCEECGHDFSEFRREAHHDDYSQPLNVVWLCGRCHGRRHRSVE